MAERLKAAVLKTVRRESVSWVRIPVPPPLCIYKFFICKSLWIYIFRGLTLSLTALRSDARGERERAAHKGAGVGSGSPNLDDSREPGEAGREHRIPRAPRCVEILRHA